MTTRTTRRTMFIASAGLDVRDGAARPSPSLPLTVGTLWGEGHFTRQDADIVADAKQARDLVAVLSESKQQIDPRLAEMARYSGGGGNRSYGGGRGGGRGGRGSGFTGSNSAALGRSRW